MRLESWGLVAGISFRLPLRKYRHIMKGVIKKIIDLWPDTHMPLCKVAYVISAVAVNTQLSWPGIISWSMVSKLINAEQAFKNDSYNNKLWKSNDKLSQNCCNSMQLLVVLSCLMVAESHLWFIYNMKCLSQFGCTKSQTLPPPVNLGEDGLYGMLI